MNSANTRRTGVGKPTKHNRYVAYYYHPITKKVVYIGSYASIDEAARARWKALQALPNKVRELIPTNYEPKAANYYNMQRNERMPYNYMFEERPNAQRAVAIAAAPTQAPVATVMQDPFAHMMNNAASKMTPPPGLYDGGRRRVQSKRSRRHAQSKRANTRRNKNSRRNRSA